MINNFKVYFTLTKPSHFVSIPQVKWRESLINNEYNNFFLKYLNANNYKELKDSHVFNSEFT